MRMFLTIFTVALIAMGCTNTEPTNTLENKEKLSTIQPKENWQVSPTFELSAKDGEGKDITVPWFGEKGRVAISANPFVAGQPQKYMWLFWGNKDEIIGKRFKVVATSEKGDQQTVLSGEHLGGENWGAPASSPSLISLPTSGLWRFDVYIDDKLHGSIVVQVK